MHDYITKLTGPCVILAGAGTGKTHSIIEKLKYMLDKKIYRPERIVCLTFSNEAVNTLRQRMLPHVTGTEEPTIRTFHSFCADLLRKHGEKIGIPTNFKIVGPDEGKILLHKYFKIHPQLCNAYIEEISIAKDLGYTVESVQAKMTGSPKEVAELMQELENTRFAINTAHMNSLSLEARNELKENQEKLDTLVKQKKFLTTWKLYEKMKIAKHWLDYADLHLKARELLTKNPDIAHEWDYVIVDEFQDTNKIQCELLTLLAPHHNITIVGDLNQSIYQFRGAYKENFVYFKQQFNVTNADMYKLDKSYRSTNKILEVAHSLIKHNYADPNDCFKVQSVYHTTGTNVEVYELKNNKEEVRKIIEIIRQELTLGTPIHEICVVFRTHQQAAMLKRQLAYEDIPFSSVNKDSLLAIPQIKLIRAYLAIIEKYSQIGSGGDHAIWELVHYTITNKQDEIILAQLLREWHESECISQKFLTEEIQDLSEEGKVQLEVIHKIITSLALEIAKPASEIIKSLYTLLGFTQDSQDPETLRALEQFHTIAEEFGQTESFTDLSSFLYHLTTIDALGITIPAPVLAKEGVRIMTNHATKGLEYNTIIMACMVQKKFPIEKPAKTPFYITEEEAGIQLAEERRLCYVGFTRAKKKLYITYAQEYNNRSYEPSQFLQEIDYHNNSAISFIKDDSESYVAPAVPELKPAIAIEKSLTFSPSSLQTFDECQKRYEFKYIYNMPEPAPLSWEAVTLGNFVHRVLEVGVSKNLKTAKEFIDCAKTIQMEEFKDYAIENALPLIHVFVKRHKDRYNSNSKTEQSLWVTLSGMKFHGYADRIDISDSGELTIIDYKTGVSDIKPKYRNWQLGLYALAAKKLGTPTALMLDMLQKEHPLEFHIDKRGIAKEIHSPRTFFNLKEVEEDLITTAKAILKAQREGFRPCSPDKNCDFCMKWIYN